MPARALSMVHGSDQDCLRELIALHSVPQPRIMDSTFGSGRLWRGLPWYPTERMDQRLLPELTWIGDFRELPTAWTSSFDVIVFDPPHVTEAGKGSRYIERFGADASSVQRAADISHMYRPFLREAVRCLAPEGIILAKLTDQVHRGVFRFQYADFIQAARECRGLTPCDYVVKDDPRSSTLTGHNWQVQRHTRRAHSFWCVVRKGRCARR